MAPFSPPARAMEAVGLESRVRRALFLSQCVILIPISFSTFSPLPSKIIHACRPLLPKSKVDKQDPEQAKPVKPRKGRQSAKAKAKAKAKMAASKQKKPAEDGDDDEETKPEKPPKRAKKWVLHFCWYAGWENVFLAEPASRINYIHLTLFSNSLIKLWRGVLWFFWFQSSQLPAFWGNGTSSFKTQMF